MKITLNKFLVVTEDETELLAQHSPRWGFCRPYPDKDPSDSFYETERGAKGAITQYKTWNKNKPREFKIIPITITIETV